MDGSLGSRLAGFGMQLLEGVDPNPENFVCAGILHGRGVQVGSLLRLEPNKQAQVRHRAGTGPQTTPPATTASRSHRNQCPMTGSKPLCRLFSSIILK